MKYCKIKKICNVLILLVCFSISSVNSQEVLITDLDFPEEIMNDVNSLIKLRKSENYKELIDLAQVYKKDNLIFGHVYDMYIVDAAFQLRDFDKIIEYVEPYVLKEQSFVVEGDAKSYLGQAYVNTNQVKEGCDLLGEVKINDPQYAIMYVSNCCKYDSYSINISGKLQNMKTNIQVSKGDVVNFQATGKVSFGMFSGYSGPEGFTNGAYRNYNRTQEMNHGELFFSVSSDPYLFYDLENLHFIKSSGYIVFHINDKQTANNSGSFKADIRVYSADDVLFKE